MRKTLGAILSWAAFAAVVATSAARPAPADLPERVQAVLRTSCAVSGCHRGNFPAKKLDLTPGPFPDSAVGVPSREVPELKIIDPGDPGRSYLVRKVTEGAEIAGKRMPIGRKPLAPEEIQALRDWIEGLDR
jgi:mono/diheme cytochrome c family protein